MKICVYTAIFGDYTKLNRPRALSESVDLICFTEKTRGIGLGWELRLRRPVFAHPRMDSKWFRMNSDLVLPEYDVTIWVDASFQLGDVDKFVEFCLDGMKLYPTAMFLHPERTDIYTEAAASMEVWRNKYADEPLMEQVEIYRRQGLPDNHKLWAGGIQIRDNRSPTVADLNRRWFAECVRWSTQDQLSLPYVLWRLGHTSLIAPLSGSVYQGPHYEWARGEDR